MSSIAKLYTVYKRENTMKVYLAFFKKNTLWKVFWKMKWNFKPGLWPKNILRCLSLILIQSRNPTIPSKKICQIQLVNRLYKPSSVKKFRKLGSQNLIFAIFFQIARGLRWTTSPQSTTSIRFFISVIQRSLFRRVKELSLCYKLWFSNPYISATQFRRL